MSREAMQMALEALESVTGHFTRTPSTLRDSEVRGEAHKAITVLRQALETEQDPVAWMSEGGDVSRSKRYMDEMGFKCNPLYTTPPKREWVGLTNEEIYEYADKYLYQHGSNYGIKAFGKAIEAKLKEKNKW